MYKVKLSVLFPDWPYLRQTPGSLGVWGNCQFVIEDKPDQSYDFWVVHDGLLQKESIVCNPQNTLLITGEPPHFKKYADGFLKQFATVFPHQGLPWMVGRTQSGHRNLHFKFNYDELKAMKSFKKDKTLSVIISGKKITPGHQQRLEFVEFLKKQTRVPIDIYGHGINEIADKWDAIAPYRYHLVLENGICPDYWTEKLADCYLGGAYPFYVGAPNLEKYFSSDSFTALDLSDFEKALKQIAQVIESDTYEKSVPAIMGARERVLDQHNLFAIMSRHIENLAPQNSKTDKTTLIPEWNFARPNLFKRLLKKIGF